MLGQGHLESAEGHVDSLLVLGAASTNGVLPAAVHVNMTRTNFLNWHIIELHH